MLSESLYQMINEISNENAAEALDDLGNYVWFLKDTFSNYWVM